MRAAQLREFLRHEEWVERSSRLTRIARDALETEGLAASLGEVCEVQARAGGPVTTAEVVGLNERRVLLLPHADPVGLRVGATVRATNRFASVEVGSGMLGRVIDAFGQPMDGARPLTGLTRRTLYPPPIPPLSRGVSTEIVASGVRGIDALFTLARGQRIGIFSGSGVGKSTLLGMIARSVQADVLVVGLVGERGREAREFVHSGLDPGARARSVVVVATSDQPAMVRYRAAYTATTVAEHFCDQGLSVCLVMDSVTRIAMALREIGLANGEIPTARGYTPGVFGALPRLLERGGVRDCGGSLTAIYSVLVDADDMSDPIADLCRATLDGHLVLSRAVGHRGRFPALDVAQSVSRLMPAVVDADDLKVATEARDLMTLYETSRDLIEVGAYKAGSNPRLDRAIRLHPKFEAYLNQAPAERDTRASAMSRLRAILAAEEAKK